MPSPSAQALIAAEIQRADGWLPFDRFMALALYAPGWGYYTNASRKFGHMPDSGSDFVTAPEMTPLFGRALAAQVAQALQVTQTDEVWEFGAGSGALAGVLLEALGDAVRRYTIVDLSGSLRARQQQRLQGFGDKVQWVHALPEAMQGVVLGNEVLDAMPVQLLVRARGQWCERGVACAADGGLTWQDRPTALRPPAEIAGQHDYLTETHAQAEAFVRTVTDKLLASAKGGAAFFIDYGFPQAEYYHLQRAGGTLMCHQAHLADDNPLLDVGSKDITAHVNFTGVALAAQQAGDDWLAAQAAGARAHEVGVLGYCTQARFLMNCGLLAQLEAATGVRGDGSQMALGERSQMALRDHSQMALRAMAHKLVAEHEMGELFKVLGLYVGQPWEALGFAQGDRTHTL